jgi:hypothetical protein
MGFRILSIVVLAVLALLGGAVIRGAHAAAHNPATHPAAHESVVKTIVFHAREPVPPQFFDIAKPAGLGPGDEGVETEILSVHGKRIGRDFLHFSVIADHSVVANGVIVLRGGQIALQGETNFQHIQVAVVGGTGVYQGVSGQLTILRTLPGEIDVDRLRLVLPETSNAT